MITKIVEEKYRLEYNESQGGFHYDNYSHQKNTMGWITICDAISAEQANEFANMMEEKYPDIGWMNIHRQRDKCPSVEQVKKEFEKFLLSEAKVQFAK